MKDFLLSFALYIVRFIMSFIYFFMKLFPTNKNKVTMLSRQSNEVSIDFEMLLEELEKENFRVIILCKKIPKQLLGKVKYCLYMLKCMYHIATSNACIVDGYVIPISSLKHKKNLIIIQIWHSMGAIKQFGKQVVNKKEGTNDIIANVMKMHNNYTNVMCVSNKTKEFYTKGFDIEEEKILPLGMPRVDYLLGKSGKIDKKVENLLKTYPNLQEKKTILYVPTFRKGQNTYIYDVIKAVDTEKYNLIIKLHPLEKAEIDGNYTVSSKYKTYELLKIADYVITDYSAVAFEACVLNKPVFFYLYDLKEYQQNRGLNINLKEEMPDSTFTNMNEIIDVIKNNTYNYENYKKFKEKYVETIDTHNTERIVKYMINLMEEKNGEKQ